MGKMTISDILLERYCLGEVGEDERGMIEGMCRVDETLQRRIDNLRRSNEDILRRYPPERIIPEIRRRAEASSPHGGRVRKVAVPAIAAAALVAVAVLFGIDKSTFYRLTHEDTRIKGGSAIFVYRKNARGIVRLKNGDRAAEHDLVQIAFISPDPHAIVLSIDGRGIVTLHSPLHEDDSTAVSAGRTVTVARSYELDDAPGFERFILITSDRPIATREVLRSARRLASDPAAARRGILSLDVPFRQASLLLVKE